MATHFFFSYNIVRLNLLFGVIIIWKWVILLKKIMIVEDEKSIREELKEILENARYQVVLLQNFEEALEEILRISPDLILLDINIPYMNGELLLQNLRKVSNIPVIMVTSRGLEVDEVLSMSYGADDYITKPYNPTILLLRIAAIFKRMEAQSDVFSYHDATLHLSRGTLKRGEEEIILTKNEMIIFSYFLQNIGKIVTRDELMTSLWNNNEYINDNALTVNISRLRNKLRELGFLQAIETRKGQGYILL